MLNEGDNFTCLCRGEDGNPPANVTWYKDGVQFSHVGTKNQTLNLLNVGGADNGSYKCVATSYPHESYTDEKSIQVIIYCECGYLSFHRKDPQDILLRKLYRRKSIQVLVYCISVITCNS